MQHIYSTEVELFNIIPEYIYAFVHVDKISRRSHKKF